MIYSSYLLQLPPVFSLDNQSSLLVSPSPSSLFPVILYPFFFFSLSPPYDSFLLTCFSPRLLSRLLSRRSEYWNSSDLLSRFYCSDLFFYHGTERGEGAGLISNSCSVGFRPGVRVMIRPVGRLNILWCCVSQAGPVFHTVSFTTRLFEVFFFASSISETFRLRFLCTQRVKRQYLSSSRTWKNKNIGINLPRMCTVHAENLVGRFLIFRFVWLIFLLFGWLNKDGGALLKHGFKAMCTYCFITTVRHLKKSMRLINLGYISLQKKNLPLFDSQSFQLQDWRFVVVCVHWAHKQAVTATQTAQI